MSRYIDAEWLIKESMPLSFSVQKWVNEVQIMTAPSIDIVRCRECKHHKPSKIWAEIKPCIVKPFPSMRCKMLNREVNADDFCSYGEREGE